MAAEAINTSGMTGDYVYTQNDFHAIAGLIHGQAGITLSDGKMMLVYSRLTKLLRARGLTRFADYVALIQKDESELAKAVEALTTNHTKLFREPHHFRHFRDHVRASLLAKAARRDKVRLWSAGCSIGQEATSLAMTFLGKDREAVRLLGGADILMLATDINEQVLETGRSGTYPIADITEIPDDYRKLWTIDQGSQFQTTDEVRRMIRYKQLNLLKDWPIKGHFDVIFCRNTMIYFDDPTKARLLARFSERLLPGGYLYIGHSERLVGPATNHFEAVGQTIYRKVMP